MGLEQPEVNQAVTGKFVLEAPEGAEGLPHHRGTGQGAGAVRKAWPKEIAAQVLTHLRRLNSEFTHYVPERRQLPLITLRPTPTPATSRPASGTADVR